MGASQPTPKTHPLASRRKPRPRVCHRRGCGRRYQPTRWNQRSCQDAECRRLIRRWQAARRQAKRRQNENVKAQQAAAERARREGAKSSPQTASHGEFAAARGHAAEKFFRSPCVAGRAAMNPRKPLFAIRLSIAAASAAKPSATSKTANASGKPAARCTAKGSLPLPAARLRTGGVKPQGKHRQATRLARRRSSDRLPCAGRHLSPGGRRGG